MLVRLNFYLGALGKHGSPSSFRLLQKSGPCDYRIEVPVVSLAVSEGCCMHSETTRVSHHVGPSVS